MANSRLARARPLAVALLPASPAAWADTGIKTGDTSLGPVLTAANGMTLYTFDNDKAPGDVTGDGANDVWHAAKPDWA